ncbi:uncharacterized protein L3040_006058 [Drepanopeziza brunnea f. sp. 'multigermtubi']|uniref:Glutathione S-transferase n=1 Tax=Marssonina brunnea f. sp. multigermtubi (strain MB_m1) TaxID=1072389 RepID=K1XM03_MARBU|nr:glutathione S-transferase [Drepanopeziza brunnea f. sp. 'multigermtubi' MB_m1]EKD21563.1 glutathione S-transferase [Drepanopeziza brunnea f. sp. 'multigermtubi' MB_m1]KAJ5040402.1 hypothetical protein L3040_006058 [Drepanopeziza brunnea f. sp. 'multigermtubi']
MPRTLTYGTESAANKAIGGVPTIHYVDFKFRGRGQVFRLFPIVRVSNQILCRGKPTEVKDAGAAYEDIRYNFEKLPEHKRAFAEMNPTRGISIIEMPKGKILTQSYAILRHWARKMGGYDGKTEDEKYWVDAITDIVIDCPSPIPIRGSELSRRGPFVAGHEITYADLFQLFHDENLIQDGRRGLQEYPRLVQLVDAVQNRPDIKKFFNSDAYLG